MVTMSQPKVTVRSLQDMKKKREPIVTVTAYDFPTAKLVNEGGADVVLVGDSLGMVVLGYESTLPVTMEEMLHHTKAVRRGNSRALLVADMPYLSYETKNKDAVKNAGLFLKAGADAVKLEGGVRMADTIRALRRANVPVMGHIGMTPQSVRQFGGYKVQGRESAEAEAVLADAKAVEEAGAFAVVLECVPSVLGERITKALSIPTIGIGAGPACDGQVLVFHDLVGYQDAFKPKFVRRYANLKETIVGAVSRYAQDVRGHKFPGSDEEYR